MRFSRKALIGIALVCLIGGSGFVVYVLRALYFEPEPSSWVSAFAAKVPVPIARVDGTFLWYADYVQHEQAMRKFIQSEFARSHHVPSEINSTIRYAILDNMIRVAVVESMAQHEGFFLTSLDIDRAHEALIARAGTSTQAELPFYLYETFGWNQNAFKERIIRPATLEQGLREDVYKNDVTFQTILEEKIREARIFVRWEKYK